MPRMCARASERLSYLCQSVVFGQRSAVQGRGFRNHAQCGRGKTGCSNKQAICGHIWVVEMEDFQKRWRGVLANIPLGVESGKVLQKPRSLWPGRIMLYMSMWGCRKREVSEMETHMGRARQEIKKRTSYINSKRVRFSN